MDIRQLNYFIAVAETKNYTHAAKSLFISQPALNKTIRKMEEELNNQLFVYQDNILQLTTAGELLYERGKPLVQEFDSIVEEIQTLHLKNKNYIKLGLTFLTSLQFMEAITKFIIEHPSIKLEIVQEGSLKLQRLLSQGDIDIAILSFPMTYSNIYMEPLENKQQYKAKVVVPTNHPLATKEQIGFEDLHDTPISSLTADYVLGDLMTKEALKEGFTSNIVFYHNDYDVLLHSLHQLNSVALLPAELEPYTRVEDICWIPFAQRSNTFTQGIGTRRDFVHTLDSIQFINAIKQTELPLDN
ncbi:LysR family transcriptional regulator [Dolosicoccus paucivorans]|nr:LysR family transcriptional regulator [Dolosicoccus paucivorans]SDI83221.1 transcriptional regulator, LysR family [Dolosicoccus paucivorans]